MTDVSDKVTALLALRRPLTVVSVRIRTRCY